MKIVRSFLYAILWVSISVFSGNAQTLTCQQAQTFAAEFFAQGARTTRSIAKTLDYRWDSRHLSPVATIETAEITPAFYVFSPASNTGFVIVSSDAKHPHILGYSFESALPKVQDLPDGMRDFLMEYTLESQQNLPSRTNYTATQMGNIVKHLETAPWGQGAPYNNLCLTTNGEPAAAGCVPVAYSILMQYHQWPLTAKEVKVYHSGTGESISLGHTYDWANILHTYSAPYTDAQATAVATLIRDMGWTYGVNYGTAGTSASEAPTKFMEVFKYKSETPRNDGNYTTNRTVMGNDVLWREYIRQSLDANLPIPYSSVVKNPATGKISGRHIFILDGYTDNDYYHFNWGWNGQGNGWYLLSNMTTDAASDYSTSHRAYFMLSPERTTYNVSVSTDCPTCGSVSATCGESTGTNISVYQGATVTLVAKPAVGYAFEKWTCAGELVSTASTCTITATANADYVAHFVVAGPSSDVAIEVSTKGGGTVTVNSQSRVSAAINTPLNLVATPATGYYFVQWQVGDEVVSKKASFTTSAQADRTYTAVFAAVDEPVRIKTSGSRGAGYIGDENVTSVTVDKGTVLKLRAVKYETDFLCWTINSYHTNGGELLSNDMETEVVAMQNTTYIANFKDPIAVTVKALANTGGTVSVAGDTTYAGEATFTATANVGYRFVNWTNGESIVSTEPCYTTIVAGDLLLTANFEPVPAVAPRPTATVPEDGKAYIIRNVHKNGSQFMLTNDYYWNGTTPTLPPATNTAAQDYANVFVCRVIDQTNGKYAFVNAKSGQFMVFHGHTGTMPYTQTGFMAYDATTGKCDLILNPCAEVEGAYTISGLRKSDNDEGWATMAIGNNGKMDAYGGRNYVSYNDSYSTLFTFEEVKDYPNQVELILIAPETDNLVQNITGTVGTFSAPYATVLPSGVTAYYAAKSETNATNSLHLVPTNATSFGIPADQGVILVGDFAASTTVLMKPATSECVEPISGNAFSNTASGAVTMQDGDYVLEKKDQGIGFYPAKGTLNANRAYLRLGTASDVEAFRLVVGESTAIENVGLLDKANPAPIYDLSGRRIMHVVKGGIYIQNGKKFIVE